MWPSGVSSPSASWARRHADKAHRSRRRSQRGRRRPGRFDVHVSMGRRSLRSPSSGLRTRMLSSPETTTTERPSSAARLMWWPAEGPSASTNPACRVGRTAFDCQVDCFIHHPAGGRTIAVKIHRVLDHLFLRLAKVSATKSDASCGGSCSQTRRTVQPDSRSTESFRRSRATVAAIFAFHQSRLALGQDMCSGQPCQKQPSTKTAS